MACNSELNSFLYKFKNLQFAGIEATLTLESKDGKAFVSLKADLGHLPPPQCPQPPPFLGNDGFHPRQYRGPAYFRRQEKRKAAREAAEKDATKAAQACGGGADPVVMETVDIHEDAEKADNDAITDISANKTEMFDCDLCDFSSSWENGLKVHMSRKHSKIEQLDGTVDGDGYDQHYEGSKHYWSKGWLGGAYQSFMDAMETVEKCDMPEDEKETLKETVIRSRKEGLGANFPYFPPWST